MLLRMRGGRRDVSVEGVDARGGRSPGQALCSRGIRMAAVGFFGARWDCGRVNHGSCFANRDGSGRRGATDAVTSVKSIHGENLFIG
jgi:hypothetical protein